MLVLTRRNNERVMIGDDIIVTVVEVSNGKVRLGFDAPDHIEIHREEIYDKVQREKGNDTTKFPL